MEAKKSHNLLSARWKTRKANDIMQFQSESQDPGAPMSEARRRGTSQVKKRDFAILPFFCPIKVLNGLYHVCSHWWGKTSLISLLFQTLISFENTFTDARRNYVLPSMWASLSSVKLTHQVNHHTHIIYQLSQTFTCITTFGPPNNSGQLH